MRRAFRFAVAASLDGIERRGTQVDGGVLRMTVARCAWAEGADAAMQHYHDTEWGVPQHDDIALFELLTLEGAQAGLSWRTVLARREAYRDAFHGFDIGRVAAHDATPIWKRLLTDSGVIRNRQKILSVRDNAQAALGVIDAHGSLDAYLWSFVDGTADRQPLDRVRARSRPPRRSPTA